MNTLKARKIDFRFDDDLPYQWNMGNPGCGNLFNLISFIGPAFERYFIRAIHGAMPRIKSESVRQEAELFCNQEGQHSRQHIRHLKMLEGKYPGLYAVHQNIMASYDRLLKDNSLEFNLSYMASLELLFTPAALFFVRNIDELFGNSDPRIASFMLWHLVEEFEHRDSALNVYNDVVGSYWFRIRNFPTMARHLNEVGRIAVEGMNRYIPQCDNPVPHGNVLTAFKDTKGRLRFVLGLADTLLPTHKADGAVEPQWISQWFKDEYEGVKDMTLYYPAL